LVQITGTTYIQDGVISSAKIGSLDAGKITTGTLDAARIKANSIDGSKLVFDQAFFNGLTANEAELKKLFAKDAFITQVQAVTLSASKIAGGILTATNKAMEVNLNNGQILYYTDRAAMKRILSGYPTQFIKFDTGTYDGKPGGVTVIGSNRDGSENPNNGSFAGIRIWNGIQSDGSFFDKMDIGADDVQIGHKVFDDGNGTYRGWQFKSYGEGSAVSLFPYGNYGRATITATNYRIFNLANNTYVNLEEVLNKIFDNFNNLNNNGNYQRSFYSSWR
ncbi:TPA: gp58-like family protein, partial [Streptococcus suis]